MNIHIRSAISSMLAATVLLISGPALAHTDEELHDGPMIRHSGKAFGHGADAKQATRTVTVTMNDDMRFVPDHFSVKQGEVVRIHVVNKGQVEHEFVMGDEEELKAHAQMMQKMPGMVHRDANTIRLGPGKEGDVVWAFTEAGDFLYVCQIPGHWEAGMEGKLTVSKNDSKK